jgi:hypothetical protein
MQASNTLPLHDAPSSRRRQKNSSNDEREVHRCRRTWKLSNCESMNASQKDDHKQYRTRVTYYSHSLHNECTGTLF